jgi:toxin CcdB
MAHFHIYENLNPASQKIYPYLIDVQSPLLSDLESRVVIPLVKKDKIEKGIIRNLNPIVSIKKTKYVVLTQQLAGIPNRYIGSSVCDCLSARQEITSAIDFLITGI